VEVAVLRALAARAPAAPPAQLEYLLQKVLMLLATMARRAGGGRSPPQLRAAAATAYHALRAVAACEARRAARAPGPRPSAPRPAARPPCAAAGALARRSAARRTQLKLAWRTAQTALCGAAACAQQAGLPC